MDLGSHRNQGSLQPGFRACPCAFVSFACNSLICLADLISLGPPVLSSSCKAVDLTFSLRISSTQAQTGRGFGGANHDGKVSCN